MFEMRNIQLIEYFNLFFTEYLGYNTGVVSLDSICSSTGVFRNLEGATLLLFNLIFF